MSPHNAANGSAQQQHHGRKKSTPIRVAIPLALSKPKPAPTRPQPRPATDATAGAEPVQQREAIAAGNKTEDVPAEKTTQHGLVATSANGVELKPQAESAEHKVQLHGAGTPVSRGSASMSLSDGQTPEPEQRESLRSATPPQTVGGLAATTSPASSGRLASIRTELPPDFIPAASIPTPQSGPSSAHTTRNSQQHYFQGHLSGPSASSILFGGHDSSNSSPAPPQPAESSFTPPSYPPAGDIQYQFGQSTHGHHYFEPPAHFSGPHQPSMPGNVPRQFYAPLHQPSHFHSNGNLPFHYPPPQPFTPVETPRANGHMQASRSASQASSNAPEVMRQTQDLMSPVAADQAQDQAKMLFPEPKMAFSNQPARRPPPMARRHMPLPLPTPSPDFRAEIDNAQAMRDHIRSSYADPSLADCHLQIINDSDGSRQYIDAHKVVLARSPTLLSVIRNSEPPASATLKTQLHVRLKGCYLSIRSFMDGLQYLYGGPLPQGERQSLSTQTAGLVPSNEECMQPSLQHVATGAWLKIPAVAIRGVELASSLLQWDTLVPALAFALDGGLGTFWIVDDGSEDRSSTTSSDDSLGRPETSNPPTYEPYATQLLHNIMTFIVHTFPPNFYSDTSAPQLTASPRLPSIPPSHESRPSRSDPRLSKIRFGELPIDEATRPSPVTTIISSVLFSLPFQLIKFLLEHPILTERLGVETVASIMRQVVLEREARRNRGQNARAAAHAAETADSQQMQNLYWEELVEPTNQHMVGLRLARRRRGIDTPPSSGAGSVKTA